MTDRSVSIHPYFKVKSSCESSFREMCDKMVAKTSAEEGCINYGFSFSGATVFVENHMLMQELPFSISITLENC